MTNINNNTSGSMSLRQILGAVDKEMGQLGLISAHEGQVAGQLSDTQVSVAKNYKAALDKYQKQNEQQQKVGSALSIVSGAVSGMGAAGGLAGLKAPAEGTFSQLAAGLGHNENVFKTVSTATQTVVAPLAQAGSSVGKAVMAEKSGEAKANETEYQAVNQVGGSVASDSINAVGQMTEQRSSIQGNLHQAVNDENQASRYDDR